MNVSIIAGTEGYTTFTGVVYLWDGQNRETLFRGEPHKVNDSTPSRIAESRAYKDACRYVQKHYPEIFNFAG
jgi:hypothetical protein